MFILPCHRKQRGFSLAQEFDKFQKIIESNTHFVLTTHINPDGDGLGSEVALAAYLEKIGKQAAILNHDATPENYKFLEQIHPFLQYDPSRHAELLKNAEVIIVLDTNHLDRLSAMKSFISSSNAFKICIDHHLEPGVFADLYIIDETATSAGEILYRLITTSASEQIIDRNIAIALYTAIMTDTGSFRYPKTDSEVHKIIANLIQAGADPAAIYEQVYEQSSANRVHLLGLALANIKLTHDGKVAHIVLTRDMFESTGAAEADTDAFVPYTLTISGVQIGLMFSELNGMVKVNFRSKGDIQINELAKQFGGNGHKNAAGARIPNANLDDIVSLVLKQTGKYV
jgi:phosphoesterase RecJ-like protein